MHVSLTCPLTCWGMIRMWEPWKIISNNVANISFLQLLIRENFGHACIFIVHDGIVQCQINIWGRSQVKFIAKANLQKNNTNKYYYNILGFSIYNVSLGKPFARVCFAQIFCTDFLHGCFARIFCMDFLHRFFAWIFCTDFLHGFLPDFFAQISVRIACKNCLFARIFLGVPKHLLGSAKISPRKSPETFTMLWGPSGKGLGRQEVRWDSGQPDQARVSEDWGGWGGVDGESSHSGGLGPKLLKAGSKSCQAKECWEREAWADHELRSWVMFQVFASKVHRKSPLHPGRSKNLGRFWIQSSNVWQPTVKH